MSLSYPDHSYGLEVKKSTDYDKKGFAFLKNFSLDTKFNSTRSDEDINKMWIRFVNYIMKEKHSEEEKNPYEAPLDTIVDFIIFLDQSENLDKKMFHLIFKAMRKYHHLKTYFREAEQFLLLVKNISSDLDIPINNDQPNISDRPIRQSDNLWREYAHQCSLENQNPFHATPSVVANIIKTIIRAEPWSENLINGEKAKRRFNEVFTGNVSLYCQMLDCYLEFSYCNKLLSETPPIQRLMKAASACDNKLMNNEIAFDLLPPYHFVLIRKNEDNTSRFWKSKLMKNVVKDVQNNILNINVAAKELGITAEMLNSEMLSLNFVKYHESENQAVSSLSEFLKYEGSDEQEFWNEPRTVAYLEEVRNRKLCVEDAAAFLGVSRSQIIGNCGVIKSLEELKAEEEIKEVERINQIEEKAKNRIKVSHLDKQIMYAEENEDDLCQYEKERLANLRERKAMMEELDIIGDKLEIRRLNRLVKLSTPKVKVDIPKRERSSRIKMQKDMKRFKLDEGSQKTILVNKAKTVPVGFANSVLFDHSDVEQFRKFNPVPKIDLDSAQLLEITNDYQASVRFLDSLSHECNDMIEGDELKQEVNWMNFDTSNEYIVSSSAISSIDSFSDLVSYGTEAGGVGVILGSKNVTLRPHSEAVTGLIMNDCNILSSSFDGTIRGFDLSKQMVTLEHSWDSNSVQKYGVLGMGKISEHSFIIDCDTNLINLDVRSNNLSVLTTFFALSDRKSHISIEPNDRNTFSVFRNDVARIYDIRYADEPVWTYKPDTFESSYAWSGWTPSGKEFSVAYYGKKSSRMHAIVQRFTSVYSVKCCLPYGDPKATFKETIVAPTLDGDVWCRWQDAVLFTVKKANKWFGTKSVISAVNYASGENVDELEIQTDDSVHVVVHCNKTKPVLVLGNTEGEGRIRILSSSNKN